MLVKEPKRNPQIPKIIMKMSFHNIQLNFPKPFGQKVTISMIGGNIKAKVDEETAPTSEITAPKLGTIAAKINVNRTIPILSRYSPTA